MCTPPPVATNHISTQPVLLLHSPCFSINTLCMYMQRYQSPQFGRHVFAGADISTRLHWIHILVIALCTFPLQACADLCSSNPSCNVFLYSYNTAFSACDGSIPGTVGRCWLAASVGGSTTSSPGLLTGTRSESKYLISGANFWRRGGSLFVG